MWSPCISQEPSGTRITSAFARKARRSGGQGRAGSATVDRARAPFSAFSRQRPASTPAAARGVDCSRFPSVYASLTSVRLATDRRPKFSISSKYVSRPGRTPRSRRRRAYHHAFWGLVRVPGRGHVQVAVAAEHGEAVLERRPEGSRTSRAPDGKRSTPWCAGPPRFGEIWHATPDRLLARNQTVKPMQ